jgi:membrane-bound lytic murein transglycosylase B
MRRLGLAALAMLLATQTANAVVANCRNTGGFDAWLAAFKREAVAQGVSAQAIAAASPWLAFEQRLFVNRTAI